MSCCDLIRPATPHLRQVSDASGTTSKDRQTSRSPCEQGLLPSPASQWKGEPRRADWLALYGFQGTISACPSSGRVENFASLLLRPCWALKSIHWILDLKGMEELTSARSSAPWRGKATALATSWITSNTRGEKGAQQPGRDAQRSRNHSLYSLHTIWPIFLAIQMHLSLLNFMAASFTS